MGLLDSMLGSSFDDPKTMAAMSMAQGLLSAQRPMQGDASGVQGYMQALAQAKEQKQREEARAMQMQMQQMQLGQAQREQTQQAAQEKFRSSIPSPQMQASQGALGGGGGPTLANAANMRPGDPQADMKYKAMQAGLIAPMDYLSKPAPTISKPGDVARDQSGRVVWQNADKNDAPSAVKEYEFARAQGYPGTFRDFTLEGKRAGASNVSVSMAGPKAFEQELGKLDAKQLDVWRTGAEAAQNSLNLVRNLRTAESQGAYSGGTAGARMGAANIVNGLTGATPKGFIGSQLYNAEASKLVLEHIKMLGANPSNADREFIEKTVPQLSTSAEARKQMTDYIEQKASKSISLYKRAEGHARKNSGLSGFDVFEGASTSIDDLVNKYGGGK